MDADRRDWTNQHGYVVPTETEAIRHLTDEETQLNKARQLYGIFVRNCCLVGFHLNDFEIEIHGKKYRMEDLKRT